jgi:hypothetical protein
MKVLELFAGKNTFSRMARNEFGCETLTTDWKRMPGIDVVSDIKDFQLIETFTPDIVFASPECKCYSIASGGKHFKKKDKTYQAVSDDALEALEMVRGMIRVIREILERNPNLVFYIENPLGLIEKVSDLQLGLFAPFPMRLVKIHQCAYGRDCKKPTAIFTNSPTFKGLKCVGDACEHAKRVTKSKRYHGKSSPSLRKGYYASAALPELLCRHILEDATLFVNHSKRISSYASN